MKSLHAWQLAIIHFRWLIFFAGLAIRISDKPTTSVSYLAGVIVGFGLALIFMKPYE